MPNIRTTQENYNNNNTVKSEYNNNNNSEGKIAKASSCKYQFVLFVIIMIITNNTIQNMNYMDLPLVFELENLNNLFYKR